MDSPFVARRTFGQNQTVDPPAGQNEIRGAEAIHYLLQEGLDETALTIRAVESHREHPSLPSGTRVLRFLQHEMVYVINAQASYALMNAYGKSTNWRGQRVRIKPEQHIDYDGGEFWGMALEPLTTCQACQDEVTNDWQTKLCAWCAWEAKQE